jgi:hypothetical protein
MKWSFDRTSKIEALSSLLIVCAMGCTGRIGEVHGGSGRGSGSGSGSTAGGSGTSMPPGAVDPGTKGVHRLNSAEYNATVADVLGTKLQPADSSWRGGEIGGFDNSAAVLDVDEAQYKRYFDSAGLVADDVFAAPESKVKIVTCASVDDAVCVGTIISDTGRRIFRRPLGSDEVATYRQVYTVARQQGENHDGSIKQVLRALLSSAEFLYRIELDPNPSSTAKHPLGAYELASRLSYFLWSSAPDDALLASADDGSLTQNDRLGATVDRMLADPTKGARFVENFAGQWLGARKLPEHAVSSSVYPDWSPQMANSLTRETYLYFTEFLKTDRSWLEFVQADVNFVDASSAKLYDIPAPSGAGLVRVEVKNDNRFGFFGLGGFLALSSLADRTSPTLRGRWILRNLLCTEPPAPPTTGVPELSAGAIDPTKNVREALEEHRKNPACASCHSLFDPYGLSLEHFDGIGRYRSAYADGVTIDATAELSASDVYPQGVKFSGIQGLADTIGKNPMFSECVADFLFTYGLGRLIADTDRPYLDAVLGEWMKGTLSIRRLIHSLVMSEPFRYRHGAS